MFSPVYIIFLLSLLTMRDLENHVILVELKLLHCSGNENTVLALSSANYKELKDSDAASQFSQNII